MNILKKLQGKTPRFKLSRKASRGSIALGLLVLLSGTTFGLAKLNSPNVARAAGGGIFTIEVVPDQTSYAAGATVGWTINYSCSIGANANDTCDNIVVTMPRPSHMNNNGTVTGTANTTSNVFSGDTAVWTFTSSVPAGNSGQLHASWVSINHTTPNNSTATATAKVHDGSATGAVLATADGSTNLTAEAIFTGIKLPNTNLPILIGQNYTYTIGLYYSGSNSTGNLNLQDVVYTDQLPAAATYVSSSGNGVYDPVTHTVTWPAISSISSYIGSPNYPAGQQTVTVRYDASRNQSGDTVTNSFSWSGHGYGDSSDVKSGTASRQNPLSDNIITGQELTKRISVATPVAGEAVSWYLYVYNKSNVPMTGTLRDVLPCADNAAATTYVSDNSDPSAACQTPVTATTTLTFSNLKPNDGSTYTAIRWWANDGSSGTYTTPDPASPPYGLTMAHLGMADGVQLTAIEIDYQIDANTNPAIADGSSSFHAYLGGNTSTTLKTGDTVTNTMQVVSTAAGQEFSGTDDATFLVRGAVPIVRSGVADQAGDGVVYSPARLITWRAFYSSVSSSSDGAPVQPDWYIAMPNALRYVDDSLEFLNLPANVGQPSLVEILPGTGNFADMTMLHLRWPDGTELPPSCDFFNISDDCAIEISFQTLVTPGAPDGTYNANPNSTSSFKAVRSQAYAYGQTSALGSGYACGGMPVSYNGVSYNAVSPLLDICTYDPYDMNGDGAADTITSYNTDSFIVGRSATAFGDIMVEGSQNSSFTYSGTTTAGAVNQYKIQLVNASNDGSPLRDMIFYASLPRPNDGYVSQSSGNQTRGSDTSVSLTGPVAAPANVTVYYSTSANPCRDEVYANSANAGCVNDWATAGSISDWSEVRFLKFVVNGTYGPGEGETVTFDAVTAANAARGDMAYMSIAYVATNDANNVQLLPAEAPRVGLKVLAASLKLAKTSNPANGAAVKNGDTITYEITATNDGDLDITGAQIADDLADVLDDANLVGAPTCAATNSANCAVPQIANGKLTWSGDVAVGETITLNYTVQVKSDATGILNNSVASADNFAYCAAAGDCATEHKIAKLAVKKSADPASGSEVNQGDTITYQIEIANVGSANLAVANIADNLANVDAHATINANSFAAVSSVAGNSPNIPTRNGDDLVWSGSLNAGEKVTLTYTAAVDADAYSATLENAVVGAAKISANDEANVVSNCATGGEENCFTRHTTDDATASFTTAKTANFANGATIDQGSEITYQIAMTNTGEAPISATARDDLANVLNFANFLNDSLTAVSSVAGNTPPAPIFANNKLAWAGDLAVGETVTLTYKVKVADDAFAKTLTNSVVSRATFNGGDVPSTCATGDEENCVVRLATDDVANDLAAQKTADPANGATVAAGDEITYKITLANRGEQTLATTANDDLAEVLKFADLIQNSLAAQSSVAGNTPPAPTVANNKLSWSGEIAPNETITLIYKVKVKSDAYGAKFINIVKTSASDPSGDAVATTCDGGAEANCRTAHQTAAKPAEITPPLPPNAGETLLRDFVKNSPIVAIILVIFASGIFVLRRKLARR